LGLVQPGSVTYLPATTTQASKGGGSTTVGPVPPGSVTAPQGDADWPSIKPYLSGSP
jgi:hypothetical protein